MEPTIKRLLIWIAFAVVTTEYRNTVCNSIMMICVYKQTTLKNLS